LAPNYPLAIDRMAVNPAQVLAKFLERRWRLLDAGEDQSSHWGACD
jgi:hypothetical protein